ncbi:ATP-dependent DNA helicase chl1, partial [Paraconiothyrium brasiliense]
MVLGSPLSQRSALPDLENLFGDATFQAQSTTQTNTRSSLRIMPTGTNNMPLTYIHQPTVADPRPTNTHSDDENLGSLYQGLPRDAKIGIIISIVVIVSLSLLGCGMCFLDCRRRQRKRKERRDTHEAELMMLEMEIINGHREQQKCARKGLWDHLKPASGNEAAISTEVTRADAATKSDSLYGLGREDRGAYATVAQTEEASTDLTTHGKEINNESSHLANGHINGIVGESSGLGPSDDIPTAEDFAILSKVPDRLPWGAFLVAIVELCERFAYYGLSGPFQNYMANKYNDPNGLPGALGLKQSRATALSNFFQFWCYITPTLGAIVADQYLGKYLTIKYFSVLYMFGIVVLFVTSLPYSIKHGGAFPGLTTAMIIIGLGTGGIKSNVSPLIAEQVQSTKPFIRHLPSGKRVIVDPEVTVQRIYMIFYMCINVGSISAIATTTLELHVGFWAAFLLPLLMFGVGFWVLVSGRKKYVIKPPQGGVVGNCLKALWIASRNRFDLDSAKPSLQGPAQKKHRMTWDDKFIDELKTALLACKVFLFFPIYWLAFSQMMNNFVSQAGQMQLHGLPNDILPNIDPITLIILIPIVDRIIYPLFLEEEFELLAR